MRAHGFVCLLTLFISVSCSSSDDNSEAASSDEYNTEIRWTRYGIPHVKANDWAGLGYGFAYATATDAVCVIAKDIVMVNGNLSSFFGAENGNLESDVFHRALLTSDRLLRFAVDQHVDSTKFAAGYVAGYNRYLKDNVGSLPVSCDGRSWIRPMNQEDIARLTVGVGIRYGLGRFKEDMARAKPPGEIVVAGETNFRLEAGLGSNGVAFGKAVTKNGSGILLGNPHYPWHGSSRFHLIHTTIPGVVDSMGVSLATTAGISIGFNKDIAWTHTVSTALRFTLYELTLNPDNPLEYRYGDDYRQMRTKSIAVNAKQADGTVQEKTHTVYFSHYGPMIASEQLPWGDTRAYTIRDAVIDNTASTRTYAALSVAKSVDDIEAAISQQGVYWTNTVATDRHGTAFYADISTTPNVDAELIEDCGIKHDTIPSFVVVLDGSREACEWKSDSRSHVAGTLPAEEMPRLRRDDYVTNSNDSYWLANPASPLEGYSPIIGPERTPRTLRTRAGLIFVRELLARDEKLTANDMRNMLYSHRNFGAELLLNDVLKVCEEQAPVVLADDQKVDLGPACEVLSAWDRTATVESVGNHLWTEFWRSAQHIKDVYDIPFDPEKPVNTPRGIALDAAEVRVAIRQALANAIVTLEGAGIAINARWGDIQYALRGDRKIPIPGAQGWAGMFSMIVANLAKDKGYTPILHGNSFIQVVSWDDDGNVRPSGMLTYSQSQEADSDHFADLTEVYSRGEWIDFPFAEEDILADPNLHTLTLTEDF